MINGNVPTDDVHVQWRERRPARPVETLHLVVAFWLDQPERVGQAGSVAAAGYLGRGAPGPDDGEPFRLFFQRPGRAEPAPPIEDTRISRRQLRFTPRGAGHVAVECVGRRGLRHNGQSVRECVLQPGDTLEIEDVAVFFAEPRPESPPALRSHYETFSFGEPDPHGIVGESGAVWKLRDQIAAAAAGRDHVLVQGPSGAGKELAARAIHELSPSSRGPFVARNAATLPASLVDAELFGSARDFPNTGAPERPGIIGAADGGTLLLDEIGELPEDRQAHLLRVLDAGGEYQRLGDPRPRRSAFRLVGATNRPLDALKHDFAARFGARITVPGLGERRSDIPLIARHLLRRMGEGTPAARRYLDAADRPVMEPALMDRLLRHDYTLHTRELARLLSVAVATSPERYLALSPEVENELRRRDDPPADERAELARVLARHGGNVTQAAAELGLSRHSLGRRLKKAGVTDA